MKNFYFACFLIIATSIFGQVESNIGQKIIQNEIIRTDALTRKGQLFVYWGWNRAMYSNSDIHFKGPGYDFMLWDVVAEEKVAPVSFNNYLKPDRLTIPQTNARIGYFIKDNLAIVFGLDHLKYVMKQDQTVRFSGYINDPVYANMVKNGQIDLSDEKFLTFEHTDGLNYINLGVEKFKNINNKKSFDIVWSYGGGAGVLYPKTNAKLFGNPRSDWFHFAGFGLDVRTSLNFVFWKHWMLRVEAKTGYINMLDVKTTLDKPENYAQQDFWFGQINAGIGYTFNTRKLR